MLTVAALASVALMLATGVAHAQYATEALHTTLPGEPGTHKIVLSCSNDVAVHYLDLFVPRSDPADRYTVYENSILLNGKPLKHQMLDSQIHHIWNGIISDGDASILQEYPLHLDAAGSLAIPVVAAGDVGGPESSAWMVVTYRAEAGTSCSLDLFGGDVGVRLLLTPGAREYGYVTDTFVASYLGVQDFNAHLKERGEVWQFEPAFGNITAPETDLAAEIDDLKSGDIDLILGPSISGILDTIKDVIEGRGAVLVSCCANAHSLAVADDGIFRTMPSTDTMGRITAEYMLQNGHDVLLTVHADNLWANDYVAALAAHHAKGGGVHGADIVHEYGRDATYAIEQELAPLIQEYGADRVAIFVTPLDDSERQLMASAAAGAHAGQVRWYGTFDPVLDPGLAHDPVAAAFAEDVRFAAIQPAPMQNPSLAGIYQKMEVYLQREVNSNMLAAYDSAWLLGMAVQRVQSADPLAVRDAMYLVGEEYSGALGPLVLDSNGDLIMESFEVWSVRDGGWFISDTYP